MKGFAAAGLIAMAVAGCGKTAAPDNPSVAQVKACVSKHGLRVRGGEARPSPGDANAPDIGELVIQNGTFVAFYSDQARANRLADSVRKNAERLHGTITRHGRITVVYTRVAPGSTGKPDARIEGCV